MLSFLQQLDGGILLWIQENLRSPLLTGILTFITRLGDGGFIWILLTILLLIPKKTRKAAFSMAAALIWSLIITNLLLKNSVARVRPYEVVEGLRILIDPPQDWSFPSGHTSASLAAAVVMLRMLPRKIGIPGIILAALISLSRLYVGVHYPTDVLGGAVIGVICALLGEMCVKWAGEKIRQRKKGDGHGQGG